MRTLYPSALGDAKWLVIEPKLPTSKGFDHPRKVDLWEILNVIFYMQRSDCQWEILPHDLRFCRNNNGTIKLNSYSLDVIY